MNIKTKPLSIKRSLWIGISLIALLALIPAALTVFAEANDVNDPAGSYMEWPESELFLMSPGGANTAQISLLEPDSSLSSFTTLGNQVETDSEGWERAAASGRILTPEHDSVGYVTAQDSSLKFRFYQPGSDWLWQAADMYVPTKSNRCNSFMDLAAGDLDNYRDSQENYRDEVIIAYAGQSANNQLPVKLAVLDFSDSAEEAVLAPVLTTANTSATIDATSIVTYGDLVCAGNALAVITGDFNGDGIDEIAVAYRLNDTQYQVDVYRYTTTVNATSGAKTHSLALADSEVQSSKNHTFIAMDLAAGDFDSDGVEETVVAYSSTLGAYGGGAVNDGLANFDVVKFFTTNNLSTRISNFVFQNVADIYPIQVKIAAGTFGEPYNSECWYVEDCGHPDLSASQIVYAYGHAVGNFKVGLLYYWFENVDKMMASRVEFPSELLGTYFDIAAGGFEGDRTPENYQWSVAYNALIEDAFGGRTVTYLFNITPPTTEDGVPALTQKGSFVSPPVAVCKSCIKIRMPVVATDVDGDSVYLGAPTVITLQNPARVQFILQEPPKHAYWDQWGKQQDLDGEPGLVTLSRWQEFTSSLKLDSGKESTHSTTKTSSETMGWSTEVSAGASYSGPLKLRTAGAEFSNQFAQDWESEESTVNNNLVSTNWSFETETTWDDGIKYDIDQYEVWRYPVYGSRYVDEQNNLHYGYMDIMVPYSESVIEYMGPAANVDGWEPTWENGNILSYPRYLYSTDEVNKFLNPEDLGAFYIPCQTDMTGCEQSSNDPEVFVKKIEQVMGSKALAVGGTKDTQDYTLSGSEGSGLEQSYTETMSENFDVKAYYKKEPSKKHGGLSIDTEIGGSFDMSNSWTNASTAETKTETSRTVTISKPALETTYSYNFYPELYVTQDGAMKLAYAAEPPAENSAGAEFWENIYGDSYKYGPGKPDAALNLPNRFRPVINSANGYLSGWAPETDDVRQLIRGFFIREATPDPESGQYPILAHEVTSGETVRLEVRVYNYTLSERNGRIATLPVHFYATWRDWSNPANPVDYVQEIGTTEVTDLEPRAWKIAAINWTPELKGLVGSVQDWRIFVELDPGNIIDEIYDSDDTPAFCILTANCGTPTTNPENYIDPGQNNTGFRTVSVVNETLTGSLHHTLRDESLPSRRALMVFTERPNKSQSFNQILAGLRDFLPGQRTRQLYVGQRAFVRIQVDTDQPSILASQVILYDGDPNNGGKIIAIKKIHPGILGSTGNVAWVQWTPLSLGVHTLYARLLEPGLDIHPGNNVATLKVVVVNEPKEANIWQAFLPGLHK